MVRDHSNGWDYPGARWWKFDFHTHTPASVDYGRGPDHEKLKRISPKDWLLGFMSAEIDCVAVTDHNSGAWIDKLKEELELLRQERNREFRPLHLFPGVELSVSSGFHLLALFDTETEKSDIDSLLGAVDYDGDKGDSNGVTRKSPAEVVEIVLQRGGIPIPAHVNEPKGLFEPVASGKAKTKLDANTLRQVFDINGVLAMEVTVREFEKPQIYVERGLTWSEVLGSDSHHPKCNELPESESGRKSKYPGSHFTWVKMAHPSLEGLRLALLDGKSYSVRRSDESPQPDHLVLPTHYVESIEIAKARHMGSGEKSVRLEFNPRLNALVGGRGTGKSTVVHALRIAARREKDLTGESSQTFQRFNKVPPDPTKDGGLTKDTEIRWTLVRDGVRHRINWRQDGSGDPVEHEKGSGGWERSKVQSVTSDRFPLQLFSQGQIADLARDDRTALLNEIDRVAGVDDLRRKLDQAVASYRASRAQVRELQSRLRGLEARTRVELEDVERKLSRFEVSGHTAVLSAYRHRQRQRREVELQFEALEAAASLIEDSSDDLVLDDVPDDLFDRSEVEDLYVADLLKSLRNAVESIATETRGLAERLRSEAEKQRQAIQGSEWGARVEEAEKAYRVLSRSLEQEGVTDLNSYGSLVQEKQRLDGEVQVLQSGKQELGRLHDEAADRLESVSCCRRAISAARIEFLDRAIANNAYVRLEIVPYGDDLRAVERSVRDVLGVQDDRFLNDILVLGEGEEPKGLVADLVGGRLPKDADARASEIERRLKQIKQRFQSTCDGQNSFGGRFNNFLQRESDRNPAFLDSLLSWFPEDGLSVSYSRTGDGRHFRPISQASAGQRAAAMLAFLLAHGDDPLILDQPEDDLDNHLIYDLVVRQIRENKTRRQIIVVTHNPNIVVNGDAELVHAMEFENERCEVKQSGSLQDESMREEICRVMEGGREAFSRRYRRLGSERTHV